MLATVIIWLFHAILWSFITGLTVPEIFVNVHNAVVGGTYTFISFLPSHPIIPWTAMVMCGYMTATMMGIALVYMFARAFFSWILGG